MDILGQPFSMLDPWRWGEMVVPNCQ